MRSLGPIPNAATPIDGSEKYLVAELLIAVLLRKFGFQARESSITKFFFKALMLAMQTYLCQNGVSCLYLQENIINEAFKRIIIQNIGFSLYRL